LPTISRPGPICAGDRDEEKRNLEEVYQLFPVLRERGNQISGNPVRR